ncbi:MAG: hypothetical protein H8D78_20145 [Chloroflexi bacterium]|nr:hypothetical protein [Chloroflexota bacterium]
MSHTKEPLILRTLKRISPRIRAYLASVSVRVDDSDGWTARTSGTPHDRPWYEMLAGFNDALEAWRKNPLVRRLVSLVTDFVVADGILLTSAYLTLQRFIEEFWSHPKNHVATRLPDLCDELTRAGELFAVLSVNPVDGMSYLRFIPACEIDAIKWLEGDYETETSYHQLGGINNIEGTWWNSFHTYQQATHEPGEAAQVMLHYTVNKPVGCLRGESDLSTVLVWAKRYSRWLEDRARLHWAIRAFLWFVQVPTSKIEAKRKQYATPPDSGSVIVHDDGESWDLKTPNLQARDASADGQELKRMSVVGMATPLHWVSDERNANLATAQAMSEPTLRNYTRQQLHFCYILANITTTAYNISRDYGRRGRPCTADDVKPVLRAVERSDDNAQAQAARDIVEALAKLRDQLSLAGVAITADLNRLTLSLALRFAGQLLDPEEINALLGIEEETQE